MTVRRGSASDADAIGRVHAISRRAAYGGLVPAAALETLTTESQASYWRDRLSTEPDPFSLYVDEVDGTVAGFAMGSAHPPVATLDAIHLVPGMQGSGVAQLLHASLLTDFAAWGCTTAELWVLDGNERAQAFYRRLGWVHDGERDTHAIGGVDVPILRYRLSL
jgi:ribosomal protein S18 acetylase RimI-like enzyme